MIAKNLEKLAAKINPNCSETVIWMLCHYPEHPETDERAKTAASIHKRLKLPIWLFGSSSARYPESVESLTRKKLVKLGVPASEIFCSSSLGSAVSMDTVQEMFNVVRTAHAKGIKRIICISNPLQLLQVHGLLRRESIEIIYFPSSLKDWRWWYVSTRLALIPVAFLGMGKEFPPLKLVRYARAKWSYWPL